MEAPPVHEALGAEPGSLTSTPRAGSPLSPGRSRPVLKAKVTKLSKSPLGTSVACSSAGATTPDLKPRPAIRAKVLRNISQSPSNASVNSGILTPAPSNASSAVSGVVRPRRYIGESLSGAAAEKLIEKAAPMLAAAGISKSTADQIVLHRPSGPGVVLGEARTVAEIKEVFAAWDASIGERSLATMERELSLDEQHRLCIAHAATEVKMAKRTWTLKQREACEPRRSLTYRP